MRTLTQALTPTSIATAVRALSGNVFASAAVAYSTRIPAGSAYNGQLQTVRRSIDNDQLDIGSLSVPDANGDRWLDTPTLLDFVGAGSGFVTKLWDISGNGRHATQPNPTLQPRIVNAGVVELSGSRPAVRFTQSNSKFLTVPAFTFAPGRKFMVGTVVQLADLTTFAMRIWVAEGFEFGRSFFGTFDVDEFFSLAGSADGNGMRVPATTNPTVISHVFGTAGLAADVNGLSVNGGTLAQHPGRTGLLPAGNIVIGSDGGNDNDNQSGFDGWLSEIAFCPGEATVAVRQALERSQGAAFGITVA